MKRVALVVMLAGLSASVFAERKSELGLDYLALTKNPLLAEIMLDIEPRFIEHYKAHGNDRAFQILGAERFAYVLRQDHLDQSWIDLFQEIAPKMPLRFLELDKTKYPKLWAFGSLERQRARTQKSLEFYRLLHGKEYIDNKD